MKLIRTMVGIVSLATLAFVGGSFYLGTKTVHDLLAESEELKAAISTLTHEDQIGFAKVVKQEDREGTLYTTIRFVETARDDMLNRVLEKEYEIEGDVVHFDALIVTFSDQAVMDGDKRSLYLWRRIYGENMSPSDGHSISTPGTHPERYADLLRNLKQSEQDLFWEAVWNLANDPNALQDYGVKAIYGNAVYKRLRPGLIYVFKIGTDGQIYPETVLDLGCDVMRDSGYVILAVMLMVFCARSAEQKAVALTFDDGPNPPYTEQILQTLDEKNVCATFFLIGQQVEKFPAIGKQIQESGHEIGGHSYDWESLAFKRWKTVEDKLDKMESGFAHAGITNVTLFRPPKGMLSFGQKKKIEGRGLKVVLGDVVPGDWKDIDAEMIRYRVLKRTKPGSIIVLHDGGGDRSETVKAVPLIIDALREQGYSFVKVSELPE